MFQDLVLITEHNKDDFYNESDAHAKIYIFRKKKLLLNSFFLNYKPLFKKITLKTTLSYSLYGNCVDVQKKQLKNMTGGKYSTASSQSSATFQYRIHLSKWVFQRCH